MSWIENVSTRPPQFSVTKLGEAHQRLFQGGGKRRLEFYGDVVAALLQAHQQRQREFQRKKAPVHGAGGVEAYRRAGEGEEHVMPRCRRFQVELHAALVAADRIVDIGTRRKTGDQVVPMDFGVGHAGVPALWRHGLLGQVGDVSSHLLRSGLRGLGSQLREGHDVRK